MEKFMKTHAWRTGMAGGAAMILVLASGGSVAAEEVVNTGYFGDVAIKGYDAVAYFTEHKAVKGSEKFTYHWLGANWHFESAENRELFRREPVKYAPQYGGYCADGVSAGTITTNIDPKAWRIIDGKLYLSYDPGRGRRPGEESLQGGQLTKILAGGQTDADVRRRQEGLAIERLYYLSFSSEKNLSACGVTWTYCAPLFWSVVR
jgi:hypothetical protein